MGVDMPMDIWMEMGVGMGRGMVCMAMGMGMGMGIDMAGEGNFSDKRNPRTLS